MNRLMINGCFDGQTFENLRECGISEFDFDLRGRSENLIVFKDLAALLETSQVEKISFIFENDKPETIRSFLNLFAHKKITLSFTDTLSSEYYDSFKTPFLWTFHPLAPWREVLQSKHIQGIILPLKYQQDLAHIPQFWDVIDRRMLEVFLNPQTIEEAEQLSTTEALVSLDLNREWEQSFRKIDQDRIKKIKAWRKNETLAGQ